jgi:hypothetical protein
VPDGLTVRVQDGELGGGEVGAAVEELLEGEPRRAELDGLGAVGRGGVENKMDLGGREEGVVARELKPDRQAWDCFPLPRAL